MADKKISQLTAATTPLAGTEVLPIVQGVNTVKVAVSDLTAGRAVSCSNLTYTGTLTGSNSILNIGSGQIYKTAGGAVGIGTVSPGSSQLNILSGSLEPLRLRSSSAGWNYMVIGQASSGDLAYLGDGVSALTTGTNNDFVVRANIADLIFAAGGNTEIARCTTTGNVSIKNGNLVIGTSGKGIDFSATSEGSGTMTSELLADYEEGTWTPTGIGITLSSASGTYLRIGSQVTVFFTIDFPTTSDTSSAQISGLPFSASTNFRNGAAFGFSSGTIGYTLIAYNSVIQIYNNSGNLTTNANNSGKSYYGTLTYKV